MAVVAPGERPHKEYEHPIFILGAGYGGIAMGIELTMSGRKDIVLCDKQDSFGGQTWHEAANDTTKLQTEKGSYAPDFLLPEKGIDPDLAIWPWKRDLIQMMTDQAEKYGLTNKARFSTYVQEVRPVGDTTNGGHYTVKLLNTETNETEVVLASAFISFPGVFYLPKEMAFEGRKDFEDAGGFVWLGSSNEQDKDELEGATVVIIGHGGFMIENTRTCLEYKAHKVYCVCRRRNITGPRMVSWLVSAHELPIPGSIFVEALNVMYNLIGQDIWDYDQVESSADRKTVLITQTCTFGVNDVYFLGCYYNFVEVVVDEVERLGAGTVELKTGRTLENAKVILQCLGFEPDNELDEVLGAKKLTGYWVNGDPLMPIQPMGSGVRAQNFGSFSIGTFISSSVKMFGWFVDYPEDIVSILPRLKSSEATNGKPCYYLSDSFFLAEVGGVVGSVPGVGERMSVVDSLKARKTMESSPLEMIQGRCEAEWEDYKRQMRENGQMHDKTDIDVPYPYTLDVMKALQKTAQDTFIEMWTTKVRKHEEAQARKAAREAS